MEIKQNLVALPQEVIERLMAIQDLYRAKNSDDKPTIAEVVLRAVTNLERTLNGE